MIRSVKIHVLSYALIIFFATINDAKADTFVKVVLSDVKFAEAIATGPNLTDSIRLMGLGFAMTDHNLSGNSISLRITGALNSKDNSGLLRERCMQLGEKIFKTNASSPYALPAFAVEGYASSIQEDHGGNIAIQYSSISRCFITSEY